VLFAARICRTLLWASLENNELHDCSFAVGALVLGHLRRELVPLMLTSAVSFTVFYFVLFLCVEESLFAAREDAIGSVAYE